LSARRIAQGSRSTVSDDVVRPDQPDALTSPPSSRTKALTPHAPRLTPHDLRGPPSMPRAELGIHGLNRWLVKCIEMSRKRGVQATGNAPSEDRKCWQGVELCIHGLRSWRCNLSRKVRATRGSSLCSALLARITRCKFLQPSRYLCQFMYLTTVKRVLRNSFDLNYLRKMCGTWVQAARLPLEPGGTGSKVSYRSHHAQRSG
jgi:hypothetical protein